MNCEMVQRRLLASEKPDQPPSELADHLATCGSCQDWHRRLLQVELNIGLIPVPAVPFSRQSFLDRLNRNKALPMPKGELSSRRLLRWAYPLSGVAAATLLFIIFWKGHSERPVAEAAKKTARPDLVSSLLARDVKLAKASTSQERISELSKLAEDLQGETRHLARVAAPGDLLALANLYKRVVEDGIIKRATALPAKDRPKILKPIVEGLARVRLEAEDLAQEVPQAAASLQVIALAARKGNDDLTGLLAATKGGTQ